jgi:hypothetical protein
VRASKCQDKQQPRSRYRDEKAGYTAADCQQDAFNQRLRDDLPAASPDGEP